MKLLCTIQEYKKAYADVFLTCECEYCSKPFSVEKRYITREFVYKNGWRSFCSPRCRNLHNGTLVVPTCGTCNKEFDISASELRKSKSGKSFCCRSCAVTYNNTHKTTGTRISKLEKYLQKELPKLYNFEIKFNSKSEINSELDIYIPSLKLAFELNGIFHYEPIFGEDKLKQIKNNDTRKFQACLEHKIELCIIDASTLKYFKIQNAQKYLHIITNLINKKI